MNNVSVNRCSFEGRLFFRRQTVLSKADCSFEGRCNRPISDQRQCVGWYRSKLELVSVMPFRMRLCPEWNFLERKSLSSFRQENEEARERKRGREREGKEEREKEREKKVNRKEEGLDSRLKEQDSGMKLPSILLFPSCSFVVFVRTHSFFSLSFSLSLSSLSLLDREFL